ncbi:serine hydrolase [Chamaesiphon sp. VAR_48_metabat_135_sub]|uniref:serine hydrolase n=1 Tax=Chamaesiphon sp. VAR_48_metabat_135_sub TaxID=2964699 RepID=UPI00286BA1C1|nr:serine hydrolase [Chamaesiphon sp. VAR_48_metabat_135_sub]
MPFYKSDSHLTILADRVLADTWAEFPDLKPEQIALTWLVYDRPIPVNTGGAITPDELWKYPVRGFNYRGGERIYPASIVKLFYLLAMHEWLEQGMASPSAELDRAMRDMIIDSSNDATSLVVDTLTGTTSGPELNPGPFTTWQAQRNLINRYYQSLGWSELDSINVNQKTWSDGPYGRERIFVGEMRENRNMLTTDAVARLMHSIIGGAAVSGDRSSQMMQLFQRDLNLAGVTPDPGEENQLNGFLGAGLPPGSQIWSKAGWTSQVRHDAAYIELVDRQPCLLIVFTEGTANSQNRQILPFISDRIVAAMSQL